MSKFMQTVGSAAGISSSYVASSLQSCAWNWYNSSQYHGTTTYKQEISNTEYYSDIKVKAQAGAGFASLACSVSSFSPVTQVGGALGFGFGMYGAYKTSKSAKEYTDALKGEMVYQNHDKAVFVTSDDDYDSSWTHATIVNEHGVEILSGGDSSVNLQNAVQTSNPFTLERVMKVDSDGSLRSSNVFVGSKSYAQYKIGSDITDLMSVVYESQGKLVGDSSKVMPNSPISMTKKFGQNEIFSAARLHESKMSKDQYVEKEIKNFKPSHLTFISYAKQTEEKKVELGAQYDALNAIAKAIYDANTQDSMLFYDCSDVDTDLPGYAHNDADLSGDFHNSEEWVEIV